MIDLKVLSSALAVRIISWSLERACKKVEEIAHPGLLMNHSGVALLCQHANKRQYSSFGKLSNDEAVEVFGIAYQTCANLQPNLFYFPRCTASSEFLNGLSRLLESFAENNL